MLFVRKVVYVFKKTGYNMEAYSTALSLPLFLCVCVCPSPTIFFKEEIEQMSQMFFKIFLLDINVINSVIIHFKSRPVDSKIFLDCLLL